MLAGGRSGPLSLPDPSAHAEPAGARVAITSRSPPPEPRRSRLPAGAETAGALRRNRGLGTSGLGNVAGVASPSPPACPAPAQTLAAPSPGVEPEGQREWQWCCRSIPSLVLGFVGSSLPAAAPRTHAPVLPRRGSPSPRPRSAGVCSLLAPGRVVQAQKSTSATARNIPFKTLTKT